MRRKFKVEKTKLKKQINIKTSIKKLKTIYDNKIYIVTVPERTIRYSVSLITGVTSLITKTILPKAFKDSLTYKFTFGMLQQYLIENIAEIKEKEKEFEIDNNYMARKTAGTIIEGAGLLTVSFSPLWMFAIISDIAGGSKSYLDCLLEHLKKNNVIEKDSNYNTVSELLDGIRTSSKVAADAIDMPPLTEEEFQEFKSLLKSNINNSVQSSKELMEKIDEIWDKMISINNKENISIERISGVMTLDLIAKTGKKGYGILKATGSSSYEILNEGIINSYKESIEEIKNVGAKDYVNKHMKPFIQQSKKHFNPKKLTLTQKWIDNWVKARKES